MSLLSHSRARHLMREHFALRISSDAEHSLRQHLQSCPECSAWYERHLFVATLDPNAASAEQRLATGLGISGKRRKPALAWSLQMGFATALVALCALLLYTRRPADFATRGATEPAKLAQVLIYRVLPPGATAIGSSMHKTDELAFAYVNPAGFKKLLIFGVDEHHHVYWYHPAWSSQSQTPRAISIAAGPELRELPEAVAHDLDGKNLKIHAVFTNSDVSVRDVERMLEGGRGAAAAGGGPSSLAATLGDALETEINVVVE
jgi:hypothetical protein